uniref:Chemokine interleukin-8-like domain-containing protein n=1 Tax=Neolamprologus brichardi TaxID=32507 RepID=A0A3Q4M4U7_NEOBR
MKLNFLLSFYYYFFLLAQHLLQMSPGQCCLKFFTGRIPQKKIVSVIKTHSACLEKAFVYVTTMTNYSKTQNRMHENTRHSVVSSVLTLL